jgi:ABC-2 type transport system ATP-binding protein
MIEIKKVSKSYGSNKVIENLDLKINDGEIFGFLGPNGAGKTTLIKMMTGILSIDEGDILIGDNSITRNPVKAKENIGLIPDNPDMFLNLKGIEYLNFIADVYKVGKEERISVIKELANKFTMENALNQRIKSYSHGMRQKIIIIGVLLHTPKNWILDEPITGLDPKAIYDLKQIMKEYANNGNTVFFSTHILEVAENLCDRVGIIDKGKLLYVGTIEELRNELKENKSLEELFMEIIKND